MKNEIMNYGLHFKADIETRELLEKLASTFACSKGEVARRALRFLNMCYECQKDGGVISISNNKKQKEIIII